MSVLVKTLFCSKKGCFECVTVNDTVFVMNNIPSSAFSCLLDCKITIFKRERLVIVAKHERYNLFFILIISSCLLIIAAIHKGILFTRVTMNINIEEYFSSLQSFRKHLLYCIYFRMKSWRWSLPLTVQIIS